MSDHDRLLEEGPHEAPEPETAEEHSRRKGLKLGGGAVAGGGIAAAKVGALGGISKLFIWIFAFQALNAWRIGSWIGLALVLGFLAFALVRHARKEG